MVTENKSLGYNPWGAVRSKEKMKKPSPPRIITQTFVQDMFTIIRGGGPVCGPSIVDAVSHCYQLSAAAAAAAPATLSCLLSATAIDSCSLLLLSPTALSCFCCSFLLSAVCYCCLPDCLPACQPTCLPAWLPTCLPTYLPTYLPAYLPTCLPTYRYAAPTE